MAATILVIEDYRAHRALLHSVVSQMGCEVVEAPDGRGGIQLAERCDPALVILDLLLPDLDGLEVLRRIRELPQETPTPVLIVSACDDHARVVEALAAGADDYVTKPFDAAVLQARIKVLLRSARLQRQLAADAERAAAAAKLAAAAWLDSLDEVGGEVAAVLAEAAGADQAALWLGQDEALLGPYQLHGGSVGRLPLAPLMRDPAIARVLRTEARIARVPRVELGPLAAVLTTNDVLTVSLGGGSRSIGTLLLGSAEPLSEPRGQRLAELRDPAALTLTTVVERQRRRVTEGRYRTLFEQATEGLALVDPRSGLCRDANQALAHRLRMTPQALCHQPFAELFDPPTAQVITERLADTAADSAVVRGHLLLHEGGTQEVQIILHRVRHGHGADLVALIRDAAGDAPAAEFDGRAVGRAIRLINHEINNPLSCIVGMSQLLQMRLSEQPEHSGHLHSILESAERIEALLHKLRALALSIGGDQPMEAFLPLGLPADEAQTAG